MDVCIFCKIVHGLAPAQIIMEWRDHLAFVPLNPVVPGHILVIPKEHRDDFTEDPAITAETMRHATMIAVKPCNLITSAGREATQTVFHLHVHIVPRREGDGLPLLWTPIEK